MSYEDLKKRLRERVTTGALGLAFEDPDCVTAADALDALEANLEKAERERDEARASRERITSAMVMVDVNGVGFAAPEKVATALRVEREIVSHLTNAVEESTARADRLAFIVGALVEAGRKAERIIMAQETTLSDLLDMGAPTDFVGDISLPRLRANVEKAVDELRTAVEAAKKEMGL
jgi:hypothetical protein